MMKTLDGHDIVLRQVSKKASGSKNLNNSGNSALNSNCEDENLYKIVVSRMKEYSAFSRIADLLHLIPRKDFTKNYHTKSDLINCIDNSHLFRFIKTFENN